MSSCEGCLAVRLSEMDQYSQILKAAKERANKEQKPIFILKMFDGYTTSDTCEQNAIEAILPD